MCVNLFSSSSVLDIVISNECPKCEVRSFLPRGRRRLSPLEKSGDPVSLIESSTDLSSSLEAVVWCVD